MDQPPFPIFTTAHMVTPAGVVPLVVVRRTDERKIVARPRSRSEYVEFFLHDDDNFYLANTKIPIRPGSAPGEPVERLT